MLFVYSICVAVFMLALILIICVSELLNDRRDPAKQSFAARMLLIGLIPSFHLRLIAGLNPTLSTSVKEGQIKRSFDRSIVLRSGDTNTWKLTQIQPIFSSWFDRGGCRPSNQKKQKA